MLVHVITRSPVRRAFGTRTHLNQFRITIDILEELLLIISSCVYNNLVTLNHKKCDMQDGAICDFDLGSECNFSFSPSFSEFNSEASNDASNFHRIVSSNHQSLDVQQSWEIQQQKLQEAATAAAAVSLALQQHQCELQRKEKDLLLKQQELEAQQIRFFGTRSAAQTRPQTPQTKKGNCHYLMAESSPVSAADLIDVLQIIYKF